MNTRSPPGRGDARRSKTLATALVTGARRGIGAATAIALSEAGIHVVLAVLDPEQCKALLADIRNAGGSAEAERCDVSRWEGVRDCVADVLERHGSLDVLINNAGTMHPIAYAAEADATRWGQNVGTNLIGAYFCCRAVLPGFLDAGSGAIVNLSSGAAFHALEGWSAYCCAKAGLAMLTRTLALELKSTDIRVYGFQPGMVNTEAVRDALQVLINRIANLDPEGFLDPRAPALAIRWLCQNRPQDLAGQEVSLTDTEFRRRAGLVV